MIEGSESGSRVVPLDPIQDAHNTYGSSGSGSETLVKTIRGTVKATVEDVQAKGKDTNCAKKMAWLLQHEKGCV
jgi:hypothetical protein